MNEYDIFCKAIEIEDEDRLQQYLSDVCGDDTRLRERVGQLIKAGRQGDGGPFDQTAIPGIRDAVDEVLNKTHEADIHSQCVHQISQYLQPSQRPGSIGRLDHYEVEAVIGRGGCGIVLRGHDDKLHRTVAIKVMAPELASSSPARKRFLREARAAAAITHQNVVRIYAVAEEPCPFLVMEYIAGSTLQERLNDSGPFTVEEVTRWGLKIAKGLAASHAKGVVHRDIKPANILLESGTDEIKITDFGLARTVDDASVTQSGMITGTPLYMSPEQAQGLAVDHRTDLFSLGSVLYALCSGRSPFRATSTLSVLRRIVEDEPRPLKEIIPEIPRWMSTLIGKLHAKNPDDRLGSAQGVVEYWESSLSQGSAATIATDQPIKAILTSDDTKNNDAPVFADEIRMRWRMIAGTIFLLIALPGVYVTLRSKSPVGDEGQTNAQAATNRGVQLLGGDDPIAIKNGRNDATAIEPSDFREIHGVSEEKIREWEASLPPHFIPTWIAPRRYAEPAVFDAVATNVGREVKHAIQFIHDDWAENVGDQYQQYVDAGFYQICRAIYNDSAVMIWADNSFVEDASYWWGSQDFVNEKLITNLKFEIQIDKVNHRWLPVSLNVSHREEPYYDAIFRWQPYIDCVWYWSLDLESLQDRVDFHRRKGWRLHRISLHELSDEPIFAATFVVGETPVKWDCHFYKNDREYEQAVVSQRAMGMQIDCLSSWNERAEAHYAVVWSQRPK